MTIRIEPPEDEGVLRERVLESVGGSLGESVTLSAPFPLATAQLRPLAEGELAMSAERRWRLLAGADEPTAAVDVRLDDDGYSVVSISHGELASGFNDAVAFAERTLDDGDYALTELDVPGLHLVFAHFVDAARGVEFFVPALQELRVYSRAELVDTLREAAARTLEGWGDSPPPVARA